MRISSTVVALFALVGLTACGTTAKFVYPQDAEALVRVGEDGSKTVAVLPFEDSRKSDNSNMFGLYVIPLVPFGWGEYSKPDAAEMFTSIAKFESNPSEDLAKAAALSFRKSGLFKDAYFSFGGDDKADFILRGELKTMQYHGRVFSYGISLVAPYLWFIGAPAGTSANHLVFDLKMVNRQGETVWSYSVDREDYIVQWLYARMGRDCVMFSAEMQNGMNEALKDLASKMKEKPELFK